jgi:hypothetical protein
LRALSSGQVLERVGGYAGSNKLFPVERHTIDFAIGWRREVDQSSAGSAVYRERDAVAGLTRHGHHDRTGGGAGGDAGDDARVWRREPRARRPAGFGRQISGGRTILSL